MTFNAVRLSRFLHWVFLSGLVILPLTTVLIFLNLGWVLAHQGVVHAMPNSMVFALPMVTVTWFSKLLSLAAAALPTALTCWMFWHLAALFAGYARGEIFTPESVRHIRMAGILLLAGELLAPIFGGLMSMALTSSNPPGGHVVTLSMDSSNLAQIVTALVVIVVAKAMDQGRALQEESLLTI